MDIGSNKPSVQDMIEIPHHMVNICDPVENLTAGDFVGKITPVICDILVIVIVIIITT